MRDLRDAFAACFHPPAEAAGTRVTFYFSLNNKGDVIGAPRATLIGFNGAEDAKARDLADFVAGFDKCLPLSLDREMATTIPGKVYFLQYVVDAQGRTDQVLLRPFGSHGGYSAPPANLEPREEPFEQAGPLVNPRAAFRGPGPRIRFHPIFPRPFRRVFLPRRFRRVR